jgi:HAD superfamily hydrolase (TIGR01490 family)
MKSTKSQPIAAFDLDGTLFRWQLFHELVFELKDQGLFDSATKRDIEQALNKWQGKEFGWNEYENILLAGLKKHIPGMAVAAFETAAQKVIDRSGHKIYNYTRDLADNLKAEGYFLLAVTGSYQEIAEPFARKYGFDDCIGAILDRENGTFTNREAVRVVYGQKADRIKEYMTDRALTLNDSIAIGDSGGDISMLELVEQPIAFNPSSELLDIATKRGWKIVIERKNIAYRLENRHDELVLAETIVY